MNPNRRRMILAAGLAPALGGWAPLAWAQQAFESILMFVPAAPGGGWDGLSP